jgi:hypothetical protein
MAQEKKSFKLFIKNNVFNWQKLSTDTMENSNETYLKTLANTSSRQIFNTIAATVYPADGLDPIEKTVNGIKISSNGIKISSLNKPKANNFLENINLLSYQSFNLFQLLLSFLGVPNALHGHQIEASSLTQGDYVVPGGTLFKQILKNLAGWSEKQSPLLNILKGIILFPINVALIPIKLVLNIIRLATEALPYLIEISTMVGMAKLLNYIHENKSNSLFGKAAAAVGIAALATLHGIFKVLHVLGRAITSPYDSVRLAFKAGEDIGGILGKVAIFVFVFFSLAITAAAYIVLFPLLINLIVAQAPIAAATAANFLSPYLAPVGSALANLLIPALSSIGITLSASFASVALGVTTLAASAALLVAPFKLFLNWFSEGLDEISGVLGKIKANKDIKPEDVPEQLLSIPTGVMEKMENANPIKDTHISNSSLSSGGGSSLKILNATGGPGDLDSSYSNSNDNDNDNAAVGATVSQQTTAPNKTVAQQPVQIPPDSNSTPEKQP